MNKQILEGKLLEIGLNKDEVEVYLFLTQDGSKSALEIARGTNLNRSKVYRILDELKAKRIIESNNDSWGELYSASNPESLELMIVEQEEKVQEKRSLLDSTIEDLSNLQAGDNKRFRVKHYRGLEGLKQMLWNELKHKELYAFGSYDINNVVGKKFAEKIRHENQTRRMKIYEIGNIEGYKDYTDNKRFLDEVIEYRQIDKKIVEITNHIEVYGNTIALYNWMDGDLRGIEIYSEGFSKMLKQIFLHYWEMAK